MIGYMTAQGFSCESKSKVGEITEEALLGFFLAAGWSQQTFKYSIDISIEILL